ncbi:MAG: GNAT family N-acetyltransferase [Cyclobacteriaceae bacterium]|nr:GNAT family N-acetyltransferase [Cyclobacteriaceae bacterium]
MLIPERVETPRLILTRLQLADAEEIFYTYASKPESTRFVSWPVHQSLKDTRAFLLYARHAWEQGTDFSFAVRLKGANRLTGACGFLNDAGKIQVGYVFGPLHWGKGYATEATRALVQLLLKQPVYKIGSFIDAENHASARVLEKCGFVVEAIVKDWWQFPNQDNRSKDCVLFTYPLHQLL